MCVCVCVLLTLFACVFSISSVGHVSTNMLKQLLDVKLDNILQIAEQAEQINI